MAHTRRATEELRLTGTWGITRAQATALERHARPLFARRGERIADRAAPLPGVFAVGRGVVKLSLRGADEEERILRVVFAGETFGEPTALLGKPCQYDAYALSDVAYAVVPCSAIFQLIELDSRFARRVVIALAQRSFGILQELAAATTLRGAQRLATYLESLACQQATNPVRLPVSKTVVAALLGMKKETLSRLFHQLAIDGVIKVAGREIAILDAERLRQIQRLPPARGQAADKH